MNQEQKTVMVNDWETPVRDLLTRLLSFGFRLMQVDNGEGCVTVSHARRELEQQKALEEITATDESFLYVSHESGESDCVLYIILGNGYEDMVADYTADDTLEECLLEYEKHWEGVAVKQVPRERPSTLLDPQPDTDSDALRALVEKAYHEITGDSREDVLDVYIGRYESTRAFCRERVFLIHEQAFHHQPELIDFFDKFLDWGKVEEDLFDPNSYGFEQTTLDGYVYVFDGNA